MKFKVCGMKYEDNIIEVAGMQPDYLGLIFYDRSPRFVDGSIPEIPKNIKKVGVFVNAEIGLILEKVVQYGLSAIQLHGQESAAYCLGLKEALEHIQKSNKIELIKAFSVNSEFDFEVLNDFENACDYYLFDTKGELPGGNGFKFDWNILEDYPSTKPFFLSGGIGLEELQSIKKFKRSPASRFCYAIDVNSKFELKPGLKKSESLVEFKSYL